MREPMREQPRIPEERLRTCLEEQYGLIVVTLEFLPRGLDYNAGVYCVVSEQGTVYLLKVKSGTFYEPGCLVPFYLHEQGIPAVVAPLPTKRKTLWTRLEDWTVTVYPFIEGDTSWTGMTDAHWQELGTIFKRIHQTPLPIEGFEGLRKESFDAAEYARWVHTIEAQHVHLQARGSVSEQALRASWLAHQSAIHTAVSSLEKLARVLQRQSGPYVICHADLHPANLIRDSAGHVFVIDWDDVKLAPKERDFIYVREPQLESAAEQGIHPFFSGYGQTEIDWIALTYYCWERIVQDVIECGKDVFLRSDEEEAIRADSARLFDDLLTDGSDFAAAHAAAAHIPADLTFN